jgi:phosphatidylglycerophosphatase A
MSENRTRAAWVATPIATCLGLGYTPVAPGTAGSLGALGAAMLMVKYHGWRPLHFGLLAAVSLAPAVWAAHSAAARSGQRDPRSVVVDEAVGQWITLAGLASFSWTGWLAAFLLFRLFDIWKPAPARQVEALPGGFGIVADDVVAGLYGALVLFAAGWFNFY